MRLGMIAAPVSRVIEHRCRRRRPAKRSIVAHLNPTSPGVGLTLGQDRHGGVVTVQSLSREDVALDAPEQAAARRSGCEARVNLDEKVSPDA
jgi:hypothetical protein